MTPEPLEPFFLRVRSSWPTILALLSVSLQRVLMRVRVRITVDKT